jgi:hypothetical protein
MMKAMADIPSVWPEENQTPCPVNPDGRWHAWRAASGYPPDIYHLAFEAELESVCEFCGARKYP